MKSKQRVLRAIVFASLALSFSELRADINRDTLATLKSRFAAADKNGDGRLTREECQAGMPRMYRGFDRIDSDKKGYITLEQIISFVASR